MLCVNSTGICSHALSCCTLVGGSISKRYKQNIEPRFHLRMRSTAFVKPQLAKSAPEIPAEGKG